MSGHRLRIDIAGVEFDGAYAPLGAHVSVEMPTLYMEEENRRRVAQLEFQVREQTEHRVRAETEAHRLRQLYRPWYRRLLGLR